MKLASPEEIRRGVTAHDPGKCYHGYTLYNSRHTEVANLIDLEGNVIHRWSYPQGYTWHYTELLPNGHLCAIVKEEMLLELDWEGDLFRKMDITAHHDFDRLDNGNTVVLCRRDNYYVIELTPDDRIVWEWHPSDHLEELRGLIDFRFPPSDLDWTFMNTVEVLPDSPLGRMDLRFRMGNVLFSTRNVNAIGVIDKETGAVAWAWGPGVLDRQHMPTMLDNGHILVYDNGTFRGYTRILELDPQAEEIVWEYKADPPESFFSPTRGSSQRLPNGNTFIAESDSGRLLEVTPEGEIVWEFWNPDRTEDGRRMPLYRSMRYPPDFVEQFILK